LFLYKTLRCGTLAEKKFWENRSVGYCSHNREYCWELVPVGKRQPNRGALFCIPKKKSTIQLHNREYCWELVPVGKRQPNLGYTLCRITASRCVCLGGLV
jgi:hypothetical protein